LQKPSLVYQTVSKASGELILFLLTKSTERLVNDRLKNYLQKYVLTAQEVTDQQVEAAGAKPGTPKFQKLKEQLVKKALDARPKKIEPAPEPLPQVVVGHGAQGRR
jgi:tRNA nucleotidyltransferase (CCA-adding enzyme)